jgi:hypothetical protein
VQLGRELRDKVPPLPSRGELQRLRQRRLDDVVQIELPWAIRVVSARFRRLTGPFGFHHWPTD